MKIYKTMDNGIQIVEYNDDLAATIADMQNKSADEWGGGSSVTTAEQVISNYSNSSCYNVFIAVHNGEAVGICTFSRSYTDAQMAYIPYLNVRPDYQGKKVGKELVLMAVNRTIELGYPRLDIHTWPGNTKAVPLYKKCGFLWEDRADTTHLSNYIPTVLKTELIADFFKTADWYADSSKVIEIKPDGIKTDNFEMYGYSWSKNGENLAVGFERTGRRIRFIETDDYKIEMTAPNHDLAFGLNYNVTFKVENKSGKPLDIKIASKDHSYENAEIKSYFNAEAKVEALYEFSGEFSVEPINKPINTWRMHPCVLADVYVNGKHVEFGLGIEPKFPLDVGIFLKRHEIVRIGMVFDVYITIKNMLDKKGVVSFSPPENSMIRFFDNDFSVEIEPNKTAMLHTKAETLSCGYEKLDIEYNVTSADGNKIKFTRPLHVVNRSFDCTTHYETENEYIAINGLWKLNLQKQGGHVTFNRLGHGNVEFRIPKFGKPYSEEFDLLEPTDVRVYSKPNVQNVMVLESDWVSNKFNGAVLTMVNEFTSSGVISRFYKVTNRSDKAISALYLQDQFYSCIGRRAMFKYDGEIHEIKNNFTFAFNDLHSSKLEENWVFDNSTYNKCGIYWDSSYKPEFKWGDELIFEHEIGELAPNAVFETKPCVYMNDIFNDVRSFRNYVLAIDETETPRTAAPIEVKMNGRNPFITTATDSVEAVVKNNRLVMYEGDICLSSADGLFSDSVQTNTEDEFVESNIFNVPVTAKAPGVYLNEFELKFQGWEAKHRRTLFMAGAQDANTVSTEKTDDVYLINNGKLSYKVSPSYGGGVHSLECGGNQWLFSPYPKIEPYAWWNPFLGGIDLNIWDMSASLTLRENITSEFVNVKDNFGVEWFGIKSTVTVNEFNNHKGLIYERYFVTQPALPVLCCFVRFINNTGGYKDIGYDMNTYISGKNCKQTGELTDIFAHTTTSEKEEYRIRMGDDNWADAERLIRISYEGKSARKEKLYVFTDADRNNGGISVGSDINQCSISTGAYARLISGENLTLRPVFFILTEKELSLDALTDLDRVIFC